MSRTGLANRVASQYLERLIQLSSFGDMDVLIELYKYYLRMGEESLALETRSKVLSKVQWKLTTIVRPASFYFRYDSRFGVFRAYQSPGNLPSTFVIQVVFLMGEIQVIQGHLHGGMYPNTKVTVSTGQDLEKALETLVKTSYFDIFYDLKITLGKSDFRGYSLRSRDLSRVLVFIREKMGGQRRWSRIRGEGSEFIGVGQIPVNQPAQFYMEKRLTGPGEGPYKIYFSPSESTQISRFLR